MPLSSSNTITITIGNVCIVSAITAAQSRTWPRLAVRLSDMASNRLLVRPQKTPLRGTITVPGDKSISHRSVMLAAIA
ncbi:MAG: hypothetical protein JSV68_09070, partial [Anaerolineaceae bacterium]